MRIDKAISGLQSRLTPKGIIQFGDPDADLRLAIKALEWIRDNRVDMSGLVIKRLLGETEE